jgi:hypothetical protein
VSFPERLDAELKEALKARNELKLSVVRMIKASLKNKSIEKGSALTDDEIISVLSTLAKQRKESIDQFTLGGRKDLADREQKELAVLLEYLPTQLSPEELDALIRSAIAECGATSAQDMGKVMKIVIQKTRGSADGKVVNQRVRDLLAGPAA